MFKKIKLISKVMELYDAIQQLLDKDSETIKNFTNWVNEGVKLFPSVGKTVKEILLIVKG